MRSIFGPKQLGFVAAMIALLTFAGCQTAEPRPTGVSRFVSFSVTPLYPKSYEIVAGSLLSFYGHYSVEELKAAWQKKALAVANGRSFKASLLLVRVHETDIGTGMPSKSRSVSGTITIID